MSFVFCNQSIFSRILFLRKAMVRTSGKNRGVALFLFLLLLLQPISFVKGEELPILLPALKVFDSQQKSLTDAKAVGIERQASCGLSRHAKQLSPECPIGIDAQKRKVSDFLRFEASRRGLKKDAYHDSYLYFSCKTSIGDKKLFSGSYCFTFIRAAVFQSAIILGREGPLAAGCEASQERVYKILVRNLRPDNLELMMDVASRYIAFVNDGEKKITNLQDVLLEKDELDLASSLESMRVSPPFDPHLPNDAYQYRPSEEELFKTCKWLDEPGKNVPYLFPTSQCNASISGLWVGYALIKRNIPPPYPASERCWKEKNDILDGVSGRYASNTLGISCRKPNSEIVQKLINTVEDYSPESKRLFFQGAGGGVAISAISNSCR